MSGVDPLWPPGMKIGARCLIAHGHRNVFTHDGVAHNIVTFTNPGYTSQDHIYRKFRDLAAADLKARGWTIDERYCIHPNFGNTSYTVTATRRR
jgi:hypothetical protein